MTVLVSGSLAIDHIMVFPDRFKHHILPDRIHILNVAFHVPTLRKTWGGTAGNIAYHLRLLGCDPLILATVGRDFTEYAEWLDRHAIRRDGIRMIEDEFTAQCFITTDLDDNQIIAFHAGAMDRAHEARVEDVREPVSVAIVSSNAKRAMLEHARALKQRRIPTMIDPSHQLPVFERSELVELIDGADVYVANDYEWALTCERAGESEDQLAKRVGAIVVTRGGEGSTIRTRDARIEIPPVAADQVVDPTGCGDAYRAGLLYGMLHRLPWERGGRLGSLLGALNVAVQGPQSVSLDRATISERYRREFGDALQ
jgi:adenosine kinase